MGGKIKKKDSKHKKISVPVIEDKFDVDYPVFCFRHLQTQPESDYKFYADFIDRLRGLSGLSWKEINVSDRHGYGYEKIPIRQIKQKLPTFVSPEMENLTVFRANGDNRPFLGFRKGNIFHLIFLEEKFNDVYDH